MISKALVKKSISRAGEVAKRVITARMLKAKIGKVRKRIDPASISATEADADFVAASRAFLERHFPRHTDLSWHIAYASVNGIRRGEYIPENVFYHRVEPAINPRAAAETFSDKNMYDLLFPTAKLPPTVGRIVHGRPFSGEYAGLGYAGLLEALQRAGCDLVVKPSVETGGGRNVSVVPGDEVAGWTATELGRIIAGEENLLFQELVQQHAALAAFHPASLNTLRIVTFRPRARTVVVSAVLRMGVNNARVDNQAAGGISCGIDEAGQLRRFAYDKYFQRYSAHPSTGRAFEGFELPSYAEACDLGIALHERLPLFGMISWDIAIDSAGSPVLIEANLKWQEINFHQVNNGPLFGRYTAEMLSML